MAISKIDVAVIGGGPAGLSAAISAAETGASVLLVDRDTRLGGILKQSVNDDFGIVRYEKQLTGPEYAFNDIVTLEKTNTIVMLRTSVLKIVSSMNGFRMTLTNSHGVLVLESRVIILATGCVEVTAKQAGVHGSKPSGIMTAGTAQYYMNIMGQLPMSRAIVLGSSDIGMAVSRRLSLEGAKVLGVYEPTSKPRGLLRNVSQCLYDYDIPLHFNHTVTRTFGTARIHSLELVRVDGAEKPVKGTENMVNCDGLIVSMGLIPESTLTGSLNIPLDPQTKGPKCDQNYMTLVDGIFCCGNALHIHDIVDYISLSGELAGKAAARYNHNERSLITITKGKEVLTVIPQCLDISTLHSDVIFYFRVQHERENAKVRLLVDGAEIYSEIKEIVRPTELQCITVNFGQNINAESRIELRLE
ncbi:MAG: NAD(P)/FAD-dependent oxidoreductase [Oscillospiraceae bacterium]|nr:NAD(P)/FAD-dependent oxidoreductase [Oscillospiraceae bacterium]